MIYGFVLNTVRLISLFYKKLSAFKSIKLRGRKFDFIYITFFIEKDSNLSIKDKLT